MNRYSQALTVVCAALLAVVIAGVLETRLAMANGGGFDPKYGLESLPYLRLDGSQPMSGTFDLDGNALAADASEGTGLCLQEKSSGSGAWEFNRCSDSTDLWSVTLSAIIHYIDTRIIDNIGLAFGSTDDYTITYSSGNARLEVEHVTNGLLLSFTDAGALNIDETTSFSAQVQTNGTLRVEGQFRLGAEAASCADSGDGNPAACTLATADIESSLHVDCLDSDGCAATLDETSASAGQFLLVVNDSASAYNLTFADTAGVQELTGALTLGQLDNVTFYYTGDEWLQAGPVNNL